MDSRDIITEFSHTNSILSGNNCYAVKNDW